MARLQSFAQDTDPLVRELVPVAEQLDADAAGGAGSCRRTCSICSSSLGPLITASETGAAGDPRRDQRCDAAARRARSVPRAAQPDPHLAVAAPAADLRTSSRRAARRWPRPTTSFGGNGSGHYLRQFSPIGPETLSLASTRDPGNRGNTYPPPLWLAGPQIFNGGGKLPGSFIFPAWDCNNTGAGGDGSVTRDRG